MYRSICNHLKSLPFNLQTLYDQKHPSYNQWNLIHPAPWLLSEKPLKSLVLSNSGQVTIFLSGLQGKNLWFWIRVRAQALIADKGKILVHPAKAYFLEKKKSISRPA